MTYPKLVPGEVIAIADWRKKNSKPELYICICPHATCFLRVDDTPLWRSHYEIYQSENPWLEGNVGYVDLRQMVSFSNREIAAAYSRFPNPRGLLTDYMKRKLAEAVQRAPTLSQDIKDLATRRLLEYEMSDDDVWGAF